MYAIITDGAKQLRVEEGNEIQIDYRQANPGDEVKFETVLAYRDDQEFKVGSPTLAGASVTATILGTFQGPKHIIQKFRRRKNSLRRTGHRQIFTRVKINKIQLG